VSADLWVVGAWVPSSSVLLAYTRVSKALHKQETGWTAAVLSGARVAQQQETDGPPRRTRRS
jgi:hypothetical protein